MLIYWLQEFFGSDKVIVFSSATAAWLKRKVMAGLDTRGKIFIMLEERGEKTGGLKYQFEQIYSEDKIILGLNIRSEETGEWEPIEVVLQGPLCFITTSTEIEFSLHAETREWQIYPDDSLEQTQRIDEWYNWRELLPLDRPQKESEEINVVKAYIGLLKPHKDYRIPFINKINFKSKTVADRRRKTDFVNLMKYASYVFQGSLPIDPKTDVVFALLFIYDFVLTIADQIIYTTRGGLTKNEERILKFVEAYPEIYSVTSEGKKPRKYMKGGETFIEEEPEGFVLSTLTEYQELADLHKNTIRNALTGLARKKWLRVLREGGRGSPSVYGKPLRKLVLFSESQKKALLPEIKPISTDFLIAQVYKILYGKTGQDSEEYRVLKSLIENCAIVQLENKPEIILFQPEWHGFELFQNNTSLIHETESICCIFCKKLIHEGEDWIQNQFTENKRVHRECYRKAREGLKHE